MKLRFFLNSDGKKQYTLKEKVNGKETKPAHYKFIKIRNAPETKRKFIRKN